MAHFRVGALVEVGEHDLDALGQKAFSRHVEREHGNLVPTVDQFRHGMEADEAGAADDERVNLVGGRDDHS